MTDTEPTLPPGARMSYWIASTLREARERANIHERTMAELMSVDRRTITRWEKGDSFGRKTELDRAIAGYAYVLGYDDGRELWAAALDSWRKHGSPPRFIPVEGPAAAFAEALRVEALRQSHQQGTASRLAARVAKRKRTGGG